MAYVIRPVSFREILDAPNAKELLDEYEKECALEELAPICPDAMLYEMMEKSGGLQCFGVYDEGALVGFVSVLIWTVPHYSKKIGSNADIFLASAHRISGTGPKMIALAEGYAKEKGCCAFQWTAPVNSRFAKLLALNVDRYRRTNVVYLRNLA